MLDVHAHCVIPVEEIVKGTPLAESGGGGGNSVLGPARLAVMDEQGVDVQILTINGFWWYAADRELAAPDRVGAERGTGHVGDGASRPLRRRWRRWRCSIPTLAAEQLEDGVKRLGLRGASIGGHVNGEDLSLPKYDPFWAKAAELGVPVFMHPGGAENIIKEGALRGRGDLGNIIGNPLETTYFLSRLIFDGVFDRFPGLQVCARARRRLPAVVPRTDRGRVRGARQRQLRQQEDAERVPEVADSHRHDGVLAGRAAPPGGRGWRRPGHRTAPTCPSTGR